MRIPVPVETQRYQNPNDMTATYVTKITDTVLMDEMVVREIFANICKQVADKYVEEHYIQIAAKLDQNAIANLAIAEASKKIAEEIQRRPNIVHEVETQIFQRGIFGGVKRVG